MSCPEEQPQAQQIVRLGSAAGCRLDVEVEDSMTIVSFLPAQS